MHFGKLDDSPMFRKQLQDLEEGTEALKDRCFKFYKGCRKYTEDLGEAYDGDIAFASALESFGGGHDDPLSMAVGGPVFTKFTITLREIGTYKEVLRSKVESILSERLINFATNDLQDIKEVRKRFDKASIHYDQAREKFLSLKKGTKPDIVSEVEEDLRNARSTFEQARFNLVAALSSIEAKKKFEFLESVSATMDAHLRYFKQAYELLLQMEPYIHQVLSYAQQSRQQAIYEQAALAARMQEFRQQMEMENQRPFSDVEASPTGDGIHRIGRSSHKMIEAVMQSTPKGKVQTIKQGYLLKRSSSIRGDWKRRFFVLDSRGKLYYYHEHWGKPMGNSGHNRFSGRLHSSERHSGLLGRFLHNNHGSPQNSRTVAHHTVDLLTSTIKLDAEQTDLRFCFRIISPSKNYSLQAENAMERMDWIDKITGVIASLLNSHVSEQDTYSQRLPLCHLKNSQQLTGSECSSRSSSCELDPALCEDIGGTRAQYKNYHEHQAGPHYTSSELQERPIDLLRRVPGNDLCADCNSPEPDWASLNLGILLCIECSGVHRNLGVQVSKVRSLTLDVKVWEPSVITLFQSLGNQFCNSVWEEAFQEHDDDAWEVSGSSGPFSRSDSRSGKLNLKPAPADSLAIKEKYIHAKYIEKQFTSRRDDVMNSAATIACRIWSSVLSQNKQLVYRLLVLEDADVNTTYEQALEGSKYEIQNAMVPNQWSNSPDSEEVDIQGWTLLHLACFNGDIGMIELLVQYGAQVNAVDSWGRAPLHQCSLYGRNGCAKILLSRGANRELVDSHGKTAFQLAVEHEANADEELLS